MLHLKSFFLIVISLCFFFLLATCTAYSFENWNSNRDYEPIVLTGSGLAEYLGESVFEIFAYAYNSTEDNWIQIPLQIDEQDDSAHVWLQSPNNILDAADEIIFMARDMGDKASGPHIWVDNPESRNYKRYEIFAADPIEPGKQAYIYLYLSSTIPDTSISYMSYSGAPVETKSDTVFGVSYVEGHNNNGITDYWKIPSAAGGDDSDLLDRQKIRVSAFSVVPVELTEEDIINPAIEFITGKVRVAKKFNFTVYKDFNIDDVEVQIFYYPYSIDSEGAAAILDPFFKIEHIRQSFDLNSNALGMRFHNNYNHNILIDGSPTPDDTINTELVFEPEVNWYMFTGDPGTILTLNKLNPLANDSLYFNDDLSGQTGDGKEDTGDGESWGDAGISITGTGLVGHFCLPYTIYYLPENQLPEIGSSFAANFQTPLEISISGEAVPVELASFQAAVLKDKVKLTWTTISESNNFGFEIHRKNKYDTGWNDIDFVEGHGTTNIPHSYVYIDNNLAPAIYFYRLKQIDADGSFAFSKELQATVSAPESFALGQNYPNPFNPATIIKYQVPKTSAEQVAVTLTIYNLLGSKIKTIVSTEQSPGFYTAYWDGKDKRGKIAPAGLYVYRLRAGNNVATKRMVLMK